MWLRSIGKDRLYDSFKFRTCARYPSLIPGSKYKLPSKFLSTPARIFKSVDFPAPLGPNTPILAPRYIPRLMFLSNSFPVGVTCKQIHTLLTLLRLNR